LTTLPQPPFSRRAVAYITHGDRLLVFRHVDADAVGGYDHGAGIQVPGGAIEPGESTRAGTLREAYEETGLEGLKVRAFLGWHDVDLAQYGKSGIVRMFYYHLTFEGETPESWIHDELDPSDGTPYPIPFELYWVRFPDEVPELIGDQGFMLNKLSLNRAAGRVVKA
jgi:8-oxo-dGTP pyrophosphatase MutT (NUDIX family)